MVEVAGVFVGPGGYDSTAQTRRLRQQTFVSHSSVSYMSKVRLLLVRCPVRAHFLACRQLHFCCAFTWR